MCDVLQTVRIGKDVRTMTNVKNGGTFRTEVTLRSRDQKQWNVGLFPSMSSQSTESLVVTESATLDGVKVLRLSNQYVPSEWSVRDDGTPSHTPLLLLLASCLVLSYFYFSF